MLHREGTQQILKFDLIHLELPKALRASAYISFYCLQCLIQGFSHCRYSERVTLTSSREGFWRLLSAAERTQILEPESSNSSHPPYYREGFKEINC